MSGLMFPKVPEKKKRKKHTKSIIQEKDGTCFLCRITGDCSKKFTHKHHIIGGDPGRKLSEEYGLTVDLCPGHHQDSKVAVHRNRNVMRYLQCIGQQAFEEKYSHEKFMEVFGKNYIGREFILPDLELGGKNV